MAVMLMILTSFLGLFIPCNTFQSMPINEAAADETWFNSHCIELGQLFDGSLAITDLIPATSVTPEFRCDIEGIQLAYTWFTRVISNIQMMTQLISLTDTVCMYTETTHDSITGGFIVKSQHGINGIFMGRTISVYANVEYHFNADVSPLISFISIDTGYTQSKVVQILKFLGIELPQPQRRALVDMDAYGEYLDNDKEIYENVGDIGYNLYGYLLVLVIGFVLM
eukprot:958003_1